MGIWKKMYYLGLKKKESNSRGIFKSTIGDFPGGAVVKNPPANARDTGFSPRVQEDPTCCGATNPVRQNY